jgi:hypothetical protein
MAAAVLASLPETQSWAVWFTVTVCEVRISGQALK